MIIDQQLVPYFQEQLNRERYNQTVYEQLAVGLEQSVWDGFAKWMRKAGKEELEHYEKFSSFLIDRNVMPILTALDTPNVTEPLNPVECFKDALKLENMNTDAISQLHTACMNVGDDDACYFLIWALEEQRKAERELVDILTLFERAAGNNAAMLMLDAKLGG